jgi:hypothetical protein
VPKDVALKFVPPAAPVAVKPAAQENPVKLPTYQQNMQDWADFFFHRAPKS